MIVRTSLLLLATSVVYISTTWSMRGYACQQPQLYNQCQCPSYCSGYGSQTSGYYGGYQGGDQYTRYQEFIRTHKPKHKKKRPQPKKKFHFSEETSLEEFDSKELTRRPTTTTTQRPRTVTNSWDDEDLWEKKFVKAKTGDEDEFPEITSSEIESARVRPQPGMVRPQPTATGGGQGIGPIGIGGGVGVGGVGVNTGLGITAPGVGGGGLGGLGTGSLVGVNSGLGIGIPGVGPIGISSGLGIGK